MEFFKQRFAPVLRAAIKENSGAHGATEKKTSDKAGKTAMPTNARYGKFETGEELWKAYLALEKSYEECGQRLKEWENGENVRKEENKWKEKVDELTREYPFAVRYVAEMGEYFRLHPTELGEEHCLERALLHAMGNREDRAISETERGNADTADAEQKNTAAKTAQTETVTKTAENAVPSESDRAEAAASVHRSSDAQIADRTDPLTDGETRRGWGQSAALPNAENATDATANAEKNRAESEALPLMRRGGEIPLTAPLRPRSIREAGELAIKMMEK